MWLLKIMVVFAPFVILTSCSSSPAQSDTQTESESFHVDKEALNKGVLYIRLPEPHPKCLSIRSPKGEWYVLQDSSESIQVMPQARFDSIKNMNFKIAELKGVTWRESRKVSELIFKSQGNYLIYFADNLETEPENTYSLQETVYFKKH